MDTPTRDHTPVFIFCVVLLMCLLVYAGRTFVIDDFTLLASAANLGSAGQTDINLLAYSDWDLPPPYSLGALGPTGDYYAKKAPAPAWLAAPLFRLGTLAPWLSSTATALLLSPILTAGTAALLYSWARRMGYARGVAAAGGLLYGGATMALVYSRFLLGEPAAAFGLMLAAWAAESHHGGHGEHRDVRGILRVLRVLRGETILCGLGLGLAAGGNLALAIFAPVFALYLYLGRRDGFKRVIGMGAAFVACLALIGVYNAVRFGAPFQTGYHFDAGEGFTTPVWVGVYGLLLSPARGLLWFNPLTWLALPGWLAWRRRDARAAWVALALAAGQVILFGVWWAWAGGASWGPRFLLPAAPFLTMMALPVLERARTSRAWLAVTGAVVVIAVLVQLAGALTDVNVYAGELQTLDPRGADGPPGYPHGWRALTDPALSPIVGGARALLERGPAVAWHRDGAVDWLSLIMLVAALLVVGFGWPRRGVDPAARMAPGFSRGNPISEGNRAGAIAIIVTVLAANLALSRIPPPVTGGGGAPLQTLPAVLAGDEPGDVLLVLTPDLTWALVELTDRAPAVGLPRSAWVDDPAANRLFERALEGRRRAWLLTYDPPPPSWYEDRLRARGAPIYEESLDGYRLVVYALN
ncbi:MAG: hypothetical protein JXB47_13075 [Anaerolineae bacterium]|nr:hypothetical protein [Anaerolineae bacterium]